MGCTLSLRHEKRDNWIRTRSSLARHLSSPPTTTTMSDWIEQYPAALTERDARELAHKRYIDAYTKLADRTALLEANPSAAVASSPTPPSTGRDRSDIAT